MPTHPFDRAEPSAADLAAITAEWPLIEAELRLLDAEITQINQPSPLNRRRVRLAEAGVARAAVEVAAPPVARKAVA